MSQASITIDRTGMAGSPAPLVIADDGDIYRLTENGVGQVVRSVRIGAMENHPDVHGMEITSFSYADSAIPVELHILGSAWSAVQASLVELEAALFRLDYQVTRYVKGVTDVYRGGPCATVPVRSTVQAEIAAACFDTFAISIPLPYPIPGAP